MNVGSQHLKVKTFSRHLVNSKQKKAKTKKIVIATLMLTSMVDMFSLLVIFLLQSFSASPEVIVAGKDMKLPVASRIETTKDAPTLALTMNEVILDQKILGTLDEILKNPHPLMTGLAALRDQWQKAHENLEFKGEINVQAHKDISSHLVSQVLAMLPSQAYGSAQLAVVSGRDE